MSFIIAESNEEKLFVTNLIEANGIIRNAILEIIGKCNATDERIEKILKENLFDDIFIKYIIEIKRSDLDDAYITSTLTQRTPEKLLYSSPVKHPVKRKSMFDDDEEVDDDDDNDEEENDQVIEQEAVDTEKEDTEEDEEENITLATDDNNGTQC